MIDFCFFTLTLSKTTLKCYMTWISPNVTNYTFENVFLAPNITCYLSMLISVMLLTLPFCLHNSLPSSSYQRNSDIIVPFAWWCFIYSKNGKIGLIFFTIFLFDVISNNAPKRMSYSLIRLAMKVTGIFFAIALWKLQTNSKSTLRFTRGKQISVFRNYHILYLDYKNKDSI